MKRKMKSLIANIAYSPIGRRIVSFIGVTKLFAKYKVYSRKRYNLREAKKEFENGSVLGNLTDYKHALQKHWVSYSEYAHQYEFLKRQRRRGKNLFQG